MKLTAGTIGWILFISLFFFACEKEPISWSDTNSGFSLQIPPSFRLLESNELSQWDYSDSETLISISLFPHTKLEGTSEALQLLINSQLRDLAVRNSKELYFVRERYISGAIASEAIISWEFSGEKGYSLILIADTKQDQLQLRVTGANLSDVDNKKIDKLLKSLKIELPISE